MVPGWLTSKRNRPNQEKECNEAPADGQCRSCTKMGYVKDDFVKYFIKRFTKRAPVINRGGGEQLSTDVMFQTLSSEQ